MDEVRGDERRDVDLGMTIAKRRFEVEGMEGPEQVEGQKNHQPESFYGPGMMTVDVIGVPHGRQLPEGPVLDLPAVVTEANDRRAGDVSCGDRRHPDPLRLDRLLLTIPLPDHGPRLHRTHDPNRGERRPGRQVLDIPDLTNERPLSDDHRGLSGEDPAGILEQVAAFVLEHEDDVFLMASQQRDQRPFDIEPIAQDHVEGPGIGLKETLQKPGRAGDFILALALGFDIQKKRNRRGLDHAQDQAVIILNSPIRQPPLQTSRTASPKRGMGLVAVEDENIVPMRRTQGLVALEPGVGHMEGLPKRFRMKLREDAAQRIRAGQRSSQTAPPARMRAALFQGMKTTQPGSDHQEDAESNGGCRMKGEKTRVGQLG